MILLDTDVLIDCLRGFPAADAWLRESASQSFAVPGIVAMELVVGCRDRAELGRIQALLRRCNVLWPDTSEIQEAFNLLVAYRLGYGVSIPDCIIAAMSQRRSVPLYTFNRKHYHMFPGVSVVEPYSRAVD